MKKKHVVRGSIGLAVFFALICLVFAQEQAQRQAVGQASQEKGISKEEKFRTETASGEVSAIGKNYISIVTSRDYDAGTENEVMIPIDAKTAFSHVRELKQIKAGDLVSVEYERPEPGYSGTARAIVVSFIQSGVAAGLVSKETNDLEMTP